MAGGGDGNYYGIGPTTHQVLANTASNSSTPLLGLWSSQTPVKELSCIGHNTRKRQGVTVGETLCAPKFMSRPSGVSGMNLDGGGGGPEIVVVERTSISDCSV